MKQKKKSRCASKSGRTLYLIDGCNLAGHRCPNPEQVVAMWGDLVRTLPGALDDQIYVFVDGGNPAFLFAAQLTGIRHSLIIGHGKDGADKEMIHFACDLEHYYRQGFTKLVVGSADRCFEDLVAKAKSIGFETTSIVSVQGENAVWVRDSDHTYCLDGRRLNSRGKNWQASLRDEGSSSVVGGVVCRSR
jgi:hypothetical protein